MASVISAPYLSLKNCISELAMAKEVKIEAKVCVGIEALWEALAKDLRILIPKIIPNLVKSVEVIEGDGGIGIVPSLQFWLWYVTRPSMFEYEQLL